MNTQARAGANRDLDDAVEPGRLTIDEIVAQPGANPFPMGKSPYHCRWRIITDQLNRYDLSIPGGREAILAQVDPSLRQLTTESKAHTDWADIFYLDAMERAAYSIVQKNFTSFVDFITKASAEQARRDIKGAFRFLLRWMAPAKLLPKVVAVSNTYFSYATIKCKLDEDAKRISFLRSDMPRPLCEWHWGAARGYQGAMLSLTSAKNLRVLFRGYLPTGTSNGVEIGEFNYDVVWQ